MPPPSLCGTLEPLELGDPAEVLRQHDVAAAPQVRGQHRQREPSDDLPGLVEAVRGPADEAAQPVGVQGEHPRVLVGVPPRDRRLPDPGRTVEQQQPWSRHARDYGTGRRCRTPNYPRGMDGPGTAFDGFPVAALDFYDDLEMDNTKSFWTAHKETYDTAVKAPMTALVAALEPEFGKAKLFRPYRDVRFAKDKTPYKTHQGGFVQAGPGTGWYVQVGAPGVRVGRRLLRLRLAAAGRVPGRRSTTTAAAPQLRTDRRPRCRRQGWELGGETLKTTPRGYDADHPRIDLLRHKSMTLGKSYGFEPVIHTAGAARPGPRRLARRPGVRASGSTRTPPC